MLRRYKLSLPDELPGPDALNIEAEQSLYIPRLLHFSGLRQYERETLACFAACLLTVGDGDVVDIGGNVGVFSWIAALAGNRRVICYEPFPQLAETIRKIAEQNELRIEIERCALSDEEGTAELFISNTSDCSHSLAAEFRRSGQSVTVGIETLDLSCQRLGLKPAVIKIDTETTEPAVLRGGLETITATRPWIICEVLAGTGEEIASALAPLNYQTYRIGGPREATAISGSDKEAERNWLFAPECPDARFWEAVDRFSESFAGCRSITDRATIDTKPFEFEPDFKKRWRPIKRRRFRAKSTGSGLAFKSRLKEGERTYFFHGVAEFDEIGPDNECVALEPGRQYELSIDVVSENEDRPTLRLWAFQYDDTTRIQKDRAFLNSWDNSMTIKFDAAPTARALRVAFHVTGPGTIELGALRLQQLSAS